jgi:F0F1-type ATP synthase membrane subunit b/b'
VLDERQTRTEGAANEARAARRRYEAKLAEYETTIRQARAEGYRRSEQERAGALEERRKLIEAAKQNTNEQITHARSDIQEQVARARTALASESRQIADRISRTVLGRTVGGAD